MRRVASFTVPPPLASSSQQQQNNNNGQQRKRLRLVRFNVENINQVVCEVPSRSDLAEEDFQNILWYTKEEFKAMKREFLPIIKKLVKKLPLDDDEEEARGLEHKTPKGSKLRQQNRYQAMDAVLSEQERQWERGRNDDDYIAQIYRQSSAHCQMNAYLIGQRDAEAAATAAGAMGEDEVVVVEQGQKEETDTEDNNETTRIFSTPQDIELFEGKDSFDVEKRGSVSPTTVVVVVVVVVDG
jgi:cytochrome c556